MLYIVRFLHQTTTKLNETFYSTWLYIVRFLHQTTTWTIPTNLEKCCISFVSYIKPQPGGEQLGGEIVVYRSFPTSNHNIPEE